MIVLCAVIIREHIFITCKKCNEILAVMLLTWHNIRYYERLMQGLRQAIKAETLDEYVQDFYDNQARGDIEEL